MNKLFLAICFIFADCAVAAARTATISDVGQIPQKQENRQETAPEVKEVTAEYMENFLINRLKNAVIMPQEKALGDANNSGMHVEPSDEAKAMMAEQEKGTFQRIYERAINRADAEAAQYRGDLARQDENWQQNIEAQRQAWENPDFPVINVFLPPKGEKVVVPAQEHIPYLFNQIEILPNGMVSFNQTIIVVANGEKLKKGLTLPLPKYSTDRFGKRQKAEYSLLSVTINGQAADYKISESGDKILLVPAVNYEIEPGVYQYNFQYVSDRLIRSYDTFDEFYWDISGSAWNLVVARAGAIVILPPGIQSLGQNVFIGYPGALRDDITLITKEADNVIGFASQSPLFIGEGMHLILSLPQGTGGMTSWGQKFTWLLSDWGDILLSGGALLFIMFSYLISWKYIRSNRSQPKIRLRKNAEILRFLRSGSFDKRSFIAFLLELYRKNIIDIESADETILLIKKTDHLKSLDKAEQKAVAAIFPGGESVVNVNAQNALRFRRAYKLIEKLTRRKIQRFVLMLNSGYLFFSVGMLLIAEIAIAWLQIDRLFSFGVLLCGSLICGFGLLLWRLRPMKKYQIWLVRLAAVLICIPGLALLTAIVSPAAAVMILLAIYTIRDYTGIYAQRNGLLKRQIAESNDVYAYLEKNAANLVLGRDFSSQQANIWAFELEKLYPSTPKIADSYKLDAAAKLLSRF